MVRLQVLRISLVPDSSGTGGQGLHSLYHRRSEVAAQIPAKDPYDTSFDSDESYRRVSIVDADPFTGSFGNDSVRPFIYSALTALDAYKADQAVAAIAQKAGDERLWPMLAGLQIAAGRPGDGIKTLQRIIGAEPTESLRLWAIQHLATAHLRMRSLEEAKAQYRLLQASDVPAYRDLGAEALLQAEIQAGNADAVEGLYHSYLQGNDLGSGRTMQSAAEWFRSGKKLDAAIDALSRIADAKTLHRQERDWALMKTQSLYAESGDVEAAWATGLRLQREASPASVAAAKAIPELIRIAQRRKEAHPEESPVSTYLNDALKEKFDGLGPDRLMAVASALFEERAIDQAAALWSKIGANAEFSNHWRAKAMLEVQRVQREQGRPAESSATGIGLQRSFPAELRTRMESAVLLKETCTAEELASDLKQQCGNETQRLSRELQRAAESPMEEESTRARQLLRQLSR